MGNCLAPKESSKKKEFVESKANVETLKALYEINMKVLGSGSYGKVFLAKNKKDETIQIAIKVINKKNMSEDDLISMKSEISVM